MGLRLSSGFVPSNTHHRTGCAGLHSGYSLKSLEWYICWKMTSLGILSMGVFSCTAIFFFGSHPQRESLSSLDWAFWAYTCLVASSVSLVLLLMGIFQGCPAAWCAHLSPIHSTLQSCLCATPAISNPCVSIPAISDWKEESFSFHWYHRFFFLLLRSFSVVLLSVECLLRK